MISPRYKILSFHMIEDILSICKGNQNKVCCGERGVEDIQIFRNYNGLLTAFPKMDLPSAHGLHMVREALFLIEREAIFPAPASPSHTARRPLPPAGGDTTPISRLC